MKKRFLNIFLVLAILIMPVLAYLVQVQPVQAVGDTVLILTPPAVGWDSGYGGNSSPAYWITDCESVSPTMGGQAAGWLTSSVSGQARPYWAIVGFNTSSIPAGVQVKSIKLRIYVNTKTADYAVGQYFAIYKVTPTNPSVLIAADGRRWWYGQSVVRMSDVKDYNAITLNAWCDFDIDEGGHGAGPSDFSYILNDPDYKVSFAIMTTNQALKYSPGSWPGSAKTHSIGFVGWNYGTAPYYPQLVVTYVAAPTVPSITTVDNGAVETNTDGQEYCSNVEWGSPRAIYANEGTFVYAVGAGAVGGNSDGSGANVTLELWTEAGTKLLTHSDSIRKNGRYNWSVPASALSGVTGFVRVHETHFNVYSSWGYVSAPASTDEVTNEIYSLNTNYPQYDNPITMYIVKEGDKMFVHWKTNMTGADFGNYKLQLRLNGQSGYALVDKTITQLRTDYFSGNVTNDNNMLHWRFMIFTMNNTPGQDLKDGMIYNLATPVSTLSKGFVQPLIINTDNITFLTLTHSAYWYYAGNSEAMNIKLDKAEYKVGDTIKPTLTVPAVSNVATFLPTLVMTTIGGSTMGAGGQLIYGSNTFSVSCPTAAGSYQLRFTLSGSQVTNYQYIYDMPFTVLAAGTSGTTGPDIASGLWDKITAWLDTYGMDNPVGHWIVIIVAMVVLFIVLYKSALLRVVVPMLVFGLAILTNWLDIWIVVLLALGAGMTLYGLFRKKVSGGGGE